jgi:cyanophycin synthetase
VPADAISIIPDEQEAIEAGLRMGRPGDLLLIFADALVRSWKQVIKFKVTSGETPAVAADPAASQSNGNASAAMASPTLANPAFASPSEEFSLSSMEGLVRDERGIHLSREQDD